MPLSAPVVSSAHTIPCCMTYKTSLQDISMKAVQTLATIVILALLVAIQAGIVYEAFVA
jgi:hypothetical protein